MKQNFKVPINRKRTRLTKTNSTFKFNNKFNVFKIQGMKSKITFTVEY